MLSILRLGDKLRNKLDDAINQVTWYVDDYGQTHKTDTIDTAKLRKLVTSLKELGEIVQMTENNDRDIDKLDMILEGLTNEAKQKTE